MDVPTVWGNEGSNVKQSSEWANGMTVVLLAFCVYFAAFVALIPGMFVTVYTVVQNDVVTFEQAWWSSGMPVWVLATAAATIIMFWWLGKSRIKTAVGDIRARFRR